MATPRTEIVITGNNPPFPPPFGHWLNRDNGRIQFGFLNTDGTPLAAIAELEPQGNDFQLLRLGNPGGPVKKDTDNKVVVSGLVAG